MRNRRERSEDEKNKKKAVGSEKERKDRKKKVDKYYDQKLICEEMNERCRNRNTYKTHRRKLCSI
jgi:hypothetical protein